MLVNFRHAGLSFAYARVHKFKTSALVHTLYNKSLLMYINRVPPASLVPRPSAGVSVTRDL